MKYVVTGGLGFIGSRLVKRLLEHNHDIIIIDNCMENASNHNLFDYAKDRVKSHNIDIRDLERCKCIIKDVDGIFHLAGLSSIQNSFKYESKYYSVNVQGTQNILDIARELKVKIVFASSASVYGTQTKIPISETANTLPINPYGKTKLECERMISSTDNEFVVLRYFNVYGKNQTAVHKNIIQIFYDKICRGEDLVIYGDGSQTRDFIHVDDIVQANYSAMTSTADHNIINIGSGISTSILETANMMLKISEQNLKIKHVAAVEGDLNSSQADISHARHILSWSPTITLERGITDILNST